jgi:Protein of unknown function (DUF1353)
LRLTIEIIDNKNGIVTETITEDEDGTRRVSRAFSKEGLAAAPDQRILTTSRLVEGGGPNGEASRRFGRPYAEIAHEALFDAWGQLSEWISAQRGFYAWATEVATSRQEWQAGGEQRKDLLTGRPLERSRIFVEANQEAIPKADAAFVLLSIRRNNSRTLIMRIATISTIAALTLSTGVALYKWLEANTLVIQARQAAAEANELAGILSELAEKGRGPRPQGQSAPSVPDYAVVRRGSFAKSGRFELLSNGKLQTLSPVVYRDHEGELWIAPAGFASDGLSVPRVFWSLLGAPIDGRSTQAAIIHQYYCETRTRTWEATHKMLYESLVASGVPSTQANLLYFAVSRFGPRWVPLPQ